jgi:hypothetical protein
MRLQWRQGLLSALLLAILMAQNAQAACRQALVMALDVSSSVDVTEYQLQLTGLAGALNDPEVAQLLLSQPNAPIWLAVFEWSGRNAQRVIIPWQALETKADLSSISATLASQIQPGGTRPTGLGAALRFAGQLLLTGPDCWQRTIDVSGDGKNNDGIRPLLGKASAIYADTTVNGLVIGTDAPPGDQIPGNEIAELTSYYRQEVIHGPDAFIETALGFEDFQAAMTRKLLRELAIAVASVARP